MKSIIKRFLAILGLKDHTYTQYCFDRDADLYGISKNERFVILVVGGCLEEGVETPYSAKRSVEDILHFIN